MKTLFLLLTFAQTLTKLPPGQTFICVPNATIKTCTGTSTTSVTNPDGTVTNTVSDCAGIYHVEIFTASGVTYKITGAIDNTTDTTTSMWSNVP